MTDKIKLTEPMEQSDQISLDSIIFVQLILGDLKDYQSFPDEPYFDGLKMGDEVKATFVVRDIYGNEIVRWSGEPYVFGGPRADEENVRRQSDALNNIKKQLPELIKDQIKRNEEHYLRLSNAFLTSNVGKIDAPEPDYILKHGEKLPLSYGFTVQALSVNPPMEQNGITYTRWRYLIRDEAGGFLAINAAFGTMRSADESWNLIIQNEGLARANDELAKYAGNIKHGLISYNTMLERHLRRIERKHDEHGMEI